MVEETALDALRGHHRSPRKNLDLLARLLKRAADAWQTLAVIGIISLATWARIGGIDLGWFMLDQVRDAVQAQEIVQGRELPTVGPVASGLKVLGPFYYYLIAIPFALSRDPSVSVAFLLMLNLVATYLTYRLGLEVFGVFTGLLAAALYAVFPMAAISAMALWNPGFIPVFSTLFMYSLYRYCVGRRPWWLVATLGSLAALLQIHLSGGVFVVLLCGAWLLFRPPLRLKPLACGALLGLLLYAPYLWFEWQRGFHDLYSMFSFAGANWTAPQTQATGVVIWRALTAPFLLPEQFAAALAAQVVSSLFVVSQRVELVWFGLGLLSLVYALVRHPDRRPYALLALWMILPLALFSRKREGLLWYYFDVIYPAQFLVIGLALAAPMAWKPIEGKRRARATLIGGAVLLMIGIVVSQACFLRGYQRAIAQAGVWRFPTTISLGNPDPWGPFKTRDGYETMETMPVRFKKALVERLVSEFQVTHATYERNVHGMPALSLREDKGYFMAWLAASDPKRGIDSGRHYVILREDLHPQRAPWGERARIGPFTIVAYQPWIRHDAWKYRLDPVQGWYQPALDASTWKDVAMPARIAPDLFAYADVPLHFWGGRNVYLRGWIDAPIAAQPFQLALSLRDDFAFPHRIAALYVNGTEVPMTRSVARNAVLARHAEMAFNLSGYLHPGANLVAIHLVEADFGIGPRTDPSGQVVGPGAFDLDIYEFHD